MKATQILFRFAAPFATALCMAGCKLLEPSGVTPRTFVLTPVSTPPASTPTGRTKIVVGIRPVKMPDYLSSKAFATRRGANEIVYLDAFAWAERLDGAFQHVLAADLATLIPTDQVHLTLWSPDAITVEVEVTVEQFDVDSRGQGVLTAWWRVLSPSGDKVLAAGRFSATQNGRPPEIDPHGAASLMSSLAGDLAQKLAEAIRSPAAQPAMGAARDH